jgi:hypothetical protein
VRYPQDIVARIRQLAIDRDDDEIAASLDREGLKSTTNKRFTASMISWVRFKHRIPGPARPCGTLSVGEVAQRFGVKPSVVYYTGGRKVRLVLPSSDSQRPSILTPWSERFGRGDERWRS